MAKSLIEWTDVVWNPVIGCSKQSSGCLNCYAERMATRLAAMGRQEYQGLTRDGRWSGNVRCLPQRLDIPLSWKKPRRVFVNSMSDLFHPDVPLDFVDAVWVKMQVCNWHTYIVLTKRPQRMVEYYKEYGIQPSPNIFVGVSVENQRALHDRYIWMQDIKASVRFISVEPMLSRVDIRGFTQDIDWVICGCESGPGARPMSVLWAADLRDQCVAANVPFFLKQMMIGGKLVKMPKLFGQVWDQYPEVR